MRRRLSAILAADAVGFSRMMETDETRTLSTLKEVRANVIDPAISSHDGHIFHTAGDGLIAEFSSVVACLNAARQIQRGLCEPRFSKPDVDPISFRIGLHVGEVIVEEDDVYGDAVNIAARIQSIADAGRIWLSHQTLENLKSDQSLSVTDLGLHELKNISRPLRLYVVDDQDTHLEARSAPKPDPMAKPTVAVLPFQNLSGESEQEYFVDGLTEDIISALSNFRSFPVIARTSTFSLKGQRVDLTQAATDLGARYIVDGSVRRSGERVRVNVQLIDTKSKRQFWSKRYDRDFVDLFDLQDELARSIASTLTPELEQHELKRSLRRTDDLTAWDFYWRGMQQLHLLTPEGNACARRHFREAVARDPDFSDGWTGLGFAFLRDLSFEAAEDRTKTIGAGQQAAERAVACDPESSQAHLCLGTAHVWAERWELALAETELSIELNPSNAHARLALGNRLDLVGRTDEAIEQLERGLSINPLDPRAAMFMRYLARAYLNAHQYGDAERWIRTALCRKPDWPIAMLLLASILGHQQRFTEASKVIKSIEMISPGFTVAHLDWKPYSDEAANAHIHEGLRHARQVSGLE